MREHFTARVAILEKLLTLLLESEPLSPPLRKAPGIYLLSEGATHLYVGRTKNIQQRFRNHSNASSGHNQATFAFRIARQETGHEKATYTVEGSRSALLQDPVFSAAFERAKARVRNMQLRFIEIDDPVQQALLEIYVAICLETPLNDFENH